MNINRLGFKVIYNIGVDVVTVKDLILEQQSQIGFHIAERIQYGNSYPKSIKSSKQIV